MAGVALHRASEEPDEGRAGDQQPDADEAQWRGASLLEGEPGAVEESDDECQTERADDKRHQRRSDGAADELGELRVYPRLKRQNRSATTAKSRRSRPVKRRHQLGGLVSVVRVGTDELHAAII